MSNLLQRAERAEAERKNLHYVEMEEMLQKFLDECGIKEIVRPNYRNEPQVTIYPSNHGGPVSFTVIEMDWGPQIFCCYTKLFKQDFISYKWFSQDKIKRQWTEKSASKHSWPVKNLADLASILKNVEEYSNWVYEQMPKTDYYL